MVCLGSIGAAGRQWDRESEEVKWGSLMMTRLDVARQTVSFCYTHTYGRLDICAHRHTHSCIQRRTHWCSEPHAPPPPPSLLRNYLLFRVLSYNSNWSHWPPANPWGCAGNLSSSVYTGDGSTPRAALLTLPGTPTIHATLTHTSSCSGGPIVPRHCFGLSTACWSKRHSAVGRVLYVVSM